MQGTKVQCQFHFVGYRFTGRFDHYDTLVAKALKEVRQKLHLVPSRTDTTVVLYEPQRGPEHTEGYFYVGVAVSEQPASLPDGSEYRFIEGMYGSARGRIKEMAAIYDFVGNWIRENGCTPIWLDTLFIERYEFPIPESDLTLEEEVEVLLPMQD